MDSSWSYPDWEYVNGNLLPRKNVIVVDGSARSDGLTDIAGGVEMRPLEDMARF